MINPVLLGSLPGILNRIGRYPGFAPILEVNTYPSTLCYIANIVVFEIKKDFELR